MDLFGRRHSFRRDIECIHHLRVRSFYLFFQADGQFEHASAWFKLSVVEHVRGTSLLPVLVSVRHAARFLFTLLAQTCDNHAKHMHSMPSLRRGMSVWRNR